MLRIAQREASRLGAERSRIARTEAPLDALTREPAVTDEEPYGDAGWVRTAVARAAATGALSPAESTTLLARLDHPDDSWEKLAALLGPARTYVR